LSFHFLLPAASSFTSFLPAISSYIFGYSLPLEASIRKLKLSSSIAVVLQASQTEVVFYHLSSSIVSGTSELLSLQLPSSIFSSSIVTVPPDYAGYNYFLFFSSSMVVFFRSFILIIII
jgi:hypothetical protein